MSACMADVSSACLGGPVTKERNGAKRIETERNEPKALHGSALGFKTGRVNLLVYQSPISLSLYK
jgi:hypothetical protein